MYPIAGAAMPSNQNYMMTASYSHRFSVKVEVRVRVGHYSFNVRNFKMIGDDLILKFFIFSMAAQPSV